jgi:molybdopterin/thiamine biosynthesis adenylyltransferase
MTNAQLDEDEGRLYDRQIRLWGVTAQHRMRGASVLLVTLRGLAVEVAKNLVLAGIGNLTVTDDEIVSEDDLGSNYFLRDADVGQLVCAPVILSDVADTLRSERTLPWIAYKHSIPVSPFSPRRSRTPKPASTRSTSSASPMLPGL